MTLIPRTMGQVAGDLFGQYPALTITGPRQAGKTTLARMTFGDLPYVNLEQLDVREFAREDPRAFLARYADGAVLDEIQRVPSLLSYLQPLVDERNRPGQFVLTGSHQFELVQSITQSLAGRTGLLTLLPFSIEEAWNGQSAPDIDRLLFEGFLPRIHAQHLPPRQALADYYATYVERDLRQLVQIKDLMTFDRFVRLCAGRVGQLLNLSSLGNDCGVSHTTAREWINLLQASYVIYLHRPYFANVSKRLIKSPKLYFYDVGLATHLLGVEQATQLATHPLRGALFENLVVLEALKFRLHRGLSDQLYFYRDSAGNEIDLLYPIGPQWLPVEIKAGMTISGDFFKGFGSYETAVGKAGERIVVYGGSDEQERSAATVVPVHGLARLLSRHLP